MSITLKRTYHWCTPFAAKKMSLRPVFRFTSSQQTLPHTLRDDDGLDWLTITVHSEIATITAISFTIFGELQHVCSTLWHEGIFQKICQCVENGATTVENAELSTVQNSFIYGPLLLSWEYRIFPKLVHIPVAREALRSLPWECRNLSFQVPCQLEAGNFLKRLLWSHSDIFVIYTMIFSARPSILVPETESCPALQVHVWMAACRHVLHVFAVLAPASLL